MKLNIKMKHIKLLLIPAILISTLVNADQYNFYFPGGAEKDGDNMILEGSKTVKIVNASTYTTYDGNISGYYDLSYAALATAGDTRTPGSRHQVDFDYSGTDQQVLDFVGSNLTLRENSLIYMNDRNDVSGDSDYWYDRISTIDVTTGEVQSEMLVASSQAAYDIANDAGFNVMLSETDISRSGADYKTLTTFSKNITNSSNTTTTANSESDGGLISEKIVNDEGTSIFREEDDGTIHIGANSIVLADETVSNSGYDQISSSSDVLELGDSSSHSTIVTGTLTTSGAITGGSITDGTATMSSGALSGVTSMTTSGNVTVGGNASVAGTLAIQEPTASNHAATKKYVDGNAAMSAAIASMPTAPLGKSMLTAGMGHRDGSSAIAIGYTHTPESGDKIFNFSISHSSYVSKPTYGGGIGWSF